MERILKIDSRLKTVTNTVKKMRLYKKERLRDFSTNLRSFTGLFYLAKHLAAATERRECAYIS